MNDIEKLIKLDSESFDMIFNFLDNKFLINKMLLFCKEQEKNSDYYIGKKVGSFWKGFSNFEKLPNQKIKIFYKKEIKNSNQKIIDYFYEGIFRKLNIVNPKNDDIQDKLVSLNNDELAMRLSKLFDVDEVDFYEKLIKRKNTVIEEYEHKLKVQQEERENEIELRTLDLKNKLNLLEEQLEELKDKQKYIEIEKDRYMSLYNKQLQKNKSIIENLTKPKEGLNDLKIILSNMIEEKSVDNLTQFKKLYLNLLKSNVDDYLSNKDISMKLIIEYVLLKTTEVI